jgi:four helix bundle protein
VRNFRKLKVWEKSHKLALEVYRKSSRFPDTERFGLTSQIRRCGYSIPTNIAEGCGRESEKELARYLNISMGSASELEYLTLLVNDLNYISEDDYREISNQVIEVKRMLTSFIMKLKADG